MGRVVYSMGVSLDGFIEDAGGGIGWAEPDEELHRLANEQVRQSAALLYGRGIYEVMEDFWTAAASRQDLPEVEAEFARAYVQTPRVVFSDTLDRVAEGCRLVRSRDAVAEVTRLREQPGGTLNIGGAGLAATLVDLIDDFELFVHPVVVGGGKPFFPALRATMPLQLAGTRTFASGVVALRYERATNPGG